MDPSSILTAIGMLVGAVWVVGEIKNTTRELRNTLENVIATVTKLDQTLGHVENKTNDHEARIRVLEAQDSG
jgi:hypothetical protein